MSFQRLKRLRRYDTIAVCIVLRTFSEIHNTEINSALITEISSRSHTKRR